jgi:hypothetical protein
MQELQIPVPSLDDLNRGWQSAETRHVYADLLLLSFSMRLLFL